MKNFRKNLGALAVLLLTALFLMSCSSDGVEYFPFVTLGESENDETACGHSKYIVVVSRLASGELIEAVDSFCEKVKEKTGVFTVLSYDDEYSKPLDGEWVVFVGNVDISGVREILRSMRSNDYLCRSFKDMTVIGGRCDKATVVALDRFLNEILSVSDGEHLIPEGGGFEYFGEYAVKDLYIGNVSVRHFDIVVEDPRNTVALESAYLLRDKISEIFGYWLDVKHERNQGYEKNICIYTDSSCLDGRAELEYVGNGVLLRAIDRTGHLKNVDAFVELLCFEGTAGELRITVPRNLYTYYGELNVTDTEYINYGISRCKIVFTALELLPRLNSPNVVTDFKDAVKECSPQILLLGKRNNLNVDTVKENFIEYQSIEVENGYILTNGEFTCTEISESEKDGVLCQTIAVRDGKAEFLLIYVSGSSDADQVINIEELAGEADMPVIALTYVENGGKITLTDNRNGFFEKAAEQNINIYGKSVSYCCYADLNHIAIADESTDNRYGIKTINIQIS